MYDSKADEKAGKHDQIGVEFEVFRSIDYPEFKLKKGWYWDVDCREDIPAHPRGPDGEYFYANGPFDTSTEAYEDAMYLEDEEGTSQWIS